MTAAPETHDGPEPRADGPPPHGRRNFVLGVMNGAIYTAGMAFTWPSIVLSQFAFEMTGTNTFASLLSSVNMFTWRLPQLLVSRMVEHRERKLPFYWAGAIIRIISWIAITFVVYSAADALDGAEDKAASKLTLFWIFFGLYCVSGIGAGLGGVPFQDIVGKSVPQSKLARFFSLRVMFGRMGAVASVIVGPLLLMRRLEFPHNYAVLFGLFTIFATASATCFACVKEPMRPVKRRQRSWGELFRAGPGFLKANPAFRVFFTYRVLRDLSMMALPLYVLYAGVDRKSFDRVAFFLLVTVIAQSLGGYIAGRISETREPTTLLTVAAVGSIIVPVIALLSPWASTETVVTFGAGPRALVLSGRDMVFVAIFVVLGITNMSGMVGAQSCLLIVSPEKDRPTYTASFNTMIIPFFIGARILAGVIADRFGYQAAIAPAAVFGVISLFVAFRLARLMSNDPPRQR